MGKIVVALFSLYSLLPILLQKLRRQLRGCHPSHESSQLELQRFGREPPQSEDATSRRLMSSTRAQVTFIAETRNSSVNADQLTNHFRVSDSFVVPATGLSGGLWVMWTDDVDVNIVSSSHYYVLASVVQKCSAVSFNLVCLYGDPQSPGY